MKEVRYFYVPDAQQVNELPADEAIHAVRVLRMNVGDSMVLIDGKGTFYQAVVSMTTARRCFYEIRQTCEQQRLWQGCIHLAIAPTKLIDRMEWMVEKATEIGVDKLTFVNSIFSERKVLKLPRMEKIVIAAAKQSRKAWMPQLNGMTAFKTFTQTENTGHRFIAHCYEELERVSLFDELKRLPAGEPVTVMVGPEGDFSIEEVKQAVASGVVSVHLGNSRLRTETAGLVAVMMMHLSKQS